MQPGESGELVYTVAQADLASEITISSEDSFPAVLATSKMIGLMEFAAARVMKPLLKAGELSVGVGISITHLAPTPVQEEVRVVATYTGMEGKLYSFEVEVFDRGGKVAGGSHTRAVVLTDKIMQIAAKRMRNAEG